MSTKTYDGIGNPLTDGTWTYTWEHGRELASMGVASDFVILEQPEDFLGALGDVITFSVSARGDSLTYQWQLSNNGGQTWSNSSASGYNTASISSLTLTEARDGRLYRCKITDGSGNVLYSKPAEIILVPISITAQPEDFYGELGDTVTFSVTASGNGLSYQWQYCKNGSSTWIDSTLAGCTTANISTSIIEARIGLQYRCKITDSAGNVVYSESGQIRTDPVAILTQPEDFVGLLGDTVRFTVEAYGEGLTYQWQYCKNGSSTWIDSTLSGCTTANISTSIIRARVGQQYRCKITDGSGNVVYSEPGEIKVGQIVWDFTYDANGMRTSRTNGTTTYEYVYNGSSLSYMSVDGNTLYFAYGADGKPVCVLYNGLKYFYVTNLQGDVTAILDRTGTAVVTYTYDAWGNILSTSGSMADTLGVHNPLCYRGYVYDQETELYYLQSRYYDPQVGRFINADALVSTGQGVLSNNAYAYCNNNPMLYKDSQGKSATLAGAICGGIFGFLGAVISELQDDENGGEEGIRWDKVIECTLSGAATGAASGFVADVSIATFGVVPAMGIAAAAGGVFSGLNSAYVQNTLSGEIDPAKVASDVFLGAVSNGLCTGTSAAFEPTAKGIGDGVRMAWNQIDAELIPGLLNTGSFIVNDFLPTAITGFFAWLGGLEYDAIAK